GLAPEGERRPAVVLDDVARIRAERRAPERLRTAVRREREEDAVPPMPLEHERRRPLADARAARLRRDVEVEDLELHVARHWVREDREIVADDGEADAGGLRAERVASAAL